MTGEVIFFVFSDDTGIIVLVLLTGKKLRAHQEARPA
jgi:hypothetical protein